MAIPKIPSLPVTRGQLDKVFTVALLFNSVAAAVSVVLFFLSSWWIFLIMGTLGLPFLLGGFFIYRFTRFREPMQRYAKNFVVKLYNGILQKREGLMRRIYTTICWVLPTEEWKHINWGYASLTPKGQTLSDTDFQHEDKRFYCQLYHYLATGMGNWNTLEGKNILEIRTGGGGGLNFVAQTLNPEKAIGVDISSTQTNFCRKSFCEDPKMKFYTADTLDKVSNIGELADRQIDLIISLQSSKYVGNFKNFVEDVDRILKPGGIFAFADSKLTGDWEQLEKDLSSTSLRILKKENITNNVIQALKLDERGKWQTINNFIGSILRRTFKRIGIIKDSVIQESLSNGSNTAMAYLLHKIPQTTLEWE